MNRLLIFLFNLDKCHYIWVCASSFLTCATFSTTSSTIDNTEISDILESTLKFNLLFFYKSYTIQLFKPTYGVLGFWGLDLKSSFSVINNLFRNIISGVHTSMSSISSCTLPDNSDCIFKFISDCFAKFGQICD